MPVAPEPTRPLVIQWSQPLEHGSMMADANAKKGHITVTGHTGISVAKANNFPSPQLVS